MRILTALVLGTILPIGAMQAVQAQGTATQRVQFEAGASSATITDELESGEAVRYVLKAREGQFLSVSLRPDNQYTDYIIYVPGDDILYESSQGGGEYEGQLYLSGDHAVEVFYNGNEGTVSNYDIVFAVTDQASEEDTAMSGATEAPAGDPVDAILGEARKLCEGYENGQFDPRDAVTAVDLDGEGALDSLVDESRFSCSSAASMYCGSGGCTLHAVVGQDSWSFQAEDWRVVEWDARPILLVARDGGWCGGAGAQVCFEAVVWSLGEMLTVMQPVE